MVNEFANFSRVQSNELAITRHKWFYPYYQLTDGTFIYGKLSYEGSFRRYAVIETADGTWTIKRKGWFNRNLLINTDEEQTIGMITPQLWSRKIMLKLDDGFEAEYAYKKIFSRTQTWFNEPYGDLVNLKLNLFSVKKPYTVTFSSTLPKEVPSVSLLALIGLYLSLLRQGQAAAAAAS